MGEAQQKAAAASARNRARRAADKRERDNHQDATCAFCGFTGKLFGAIDDKPACGTCIGAALLAKNNEPYECADCYASEEQHKTMKSHGFRPRAQR